KALWRPLSWFESRSDSQLALENLPMEPRAPYTIESLPIAAMSIEIGSIIVRTPDFRSGAPHIAGTGISVHRIVRWYKQGYTPEQIADEYAHLTLAQVYAALSY